MDALQVVGAYTIVFVCRSLPYVDISQFFSCLIFSYCLISVGIFIFLTTLSSLKFFSMCHLMDLFLVYWLFCVHVC